MSDIFENLKRLSIFEKLFVAFSNKKIILKDLDKPNEHQTIKFTKDGFIDLHYTKEGSEKKYESQVRVNLIDIVKGIIENPSIIENAVQEFVKAMKKVTLDEDEFAHYNVAPMKTSDEIAEFAKQTKRKVEFPSEKVEEFLSSETIIPWKQANGKIHNYALVYDKDNPVGVIQEKDGEYFYFSISIIENSSIAKFIRTFSLQDEIDAQRKEKSL